MGFTLDSRLDDSRMVGVRDEGDNEIVISDCGFKDISSIDVQRDGRRVCKALDQLLRLFEGTAANRQMVLRPAGKVLSSGTSDEAAAKEEDLLLLLAGGRKLQGAPTENWSNNFVLLEQAPGELREDESCLVHVFVVVNSVGDISNWSLEVPLLTLGTDHKPDLTTGVGWDSSEGVFGNGKYFSSGLFQLLDQGSVQPEAFGLGRYVASGIKGVMKKLEVRFLEEGSSRSNRIRGIGDDDIV